MTLPVAARIADAVAAEINSAVTAASFETLGFTATRRLFDWDTNYKDLKDLTVEVVYVTKQPEGSVRMDTAGSLDYLVKTDVVVLKRFAPVDHDQTTGRLLVTAVDPLVRLLEQIQEHFVANRSSVPLDTETAANWVAVEPYWVDQERMRKGIFQGVTRLTFDFQRSI